MSKIETIQSNLITLKKIVEKQYIFDIPIYQRLYVWKGEQVEILLDDLYNAYKEDNDIFYLGGVLVVENKEKKNFTEYDLIDGQQRFTTLWMMSIVFKEGLCSFTNLKLDKVSYHRVNFSIRADINEFFTSYMDNDKIVKGSTSNIINALGVMESFMSKLPREELLEFSTFLFEKVQLLFTAVPQRTDLNKLFEIINNRGVQLQHHEILKAQLLKVLPSEERMKYSYLWDACSYMDNYVEKNIRDIVKIKISKLFENKSYSTGSEKLSKSQNILKQISSVETDEFKPLSLIEILSNSDESIKKNDEQKIDEEYESDNKVRSIITFSMLLQHTLRIHLFKYYDGTEYDIPKILDKELLSLFDEHYFYPEMKDDKDAAADDVRAFIELLWEVRYVFDKHVIKWVETEDGEMHLINKLYKSENKSSKKSYFTLTRRKSDINDSCALLQSMLYHSQQLTTHYWLTPYLNYLLEHKGNKNYEYLRYLDNNLLSGDDSDSLINRTHEFLVNPFYKTNIDYSILLKPEGTAFAHYWFYKLEFILWFTLKGTFDDRWQDFYFTAKNSVEHISPQTPQEVDEDVVIDHDILNSFGNLSLVSRSINSEYSNMPYLVKRQKFITNNAKKLDSLKMDLIYRHKHWNDDKAKEHQAEMLAYLDEYFKQEIDFE